MAYKPSGRSQHIRLNLPSPRHFRPWIKATVDMTRQLVALLGPAPAAEEQPKERLSDTRKMGRKPAKQGWKMWH